MESTLRGMGLGAEVDRFILSLNRAAEDAAKKAAPIFLDAVRAMTIADALGILRGADDAATQYLQRTSTERLHAEFLPVVKTCLAAAGVARHWSPLAKAYNGVPFVKPVNPDLEDYVTRRAIDGLFVLVAAEEKKIRKDPAAQVTPLLKKVFGGGQ
jgi:hypothetical protein